MNKFLTPKRSFNVLKKVGISFISIVLLYSCGQIPENENQVIRAGESIITTEYLNQIVEIAKASYLSIDALSANQIHQLRKKVIEELVEEVLILERARELKLKITEDKLNKAIMDIRKDYPDDTFESMLIEQAISYNIWKKRLKTRLLIEKTIALDLQQNINISPEEIANFHKEFPKQAISPHSDHPLKNEKVHFQVNQNAVKSFLKNEKSETKYPSWIKGLKERYGLYINEELI
ncbi:protein containing SurA [Candidatus Magnetomorum sp. HK-1]|nr:protein containing SurA [Candidatus Magnetomorum sp. HK-1]